MPEKDEEKGYLPISLDRNNTPCGNERNNEGAQPLAQRKAKEGGAPQSELGVGWSLILHSQFILIGLLLLGATVLKLFYR